MDYYSAQHSALSYQFIPKVEMKGQHYTACLPIATYLISLKADS